jgi:hypothetical protein
MPHFGGVDTQLENLDPLLQVDEERFRRRVSITSEQRWAAAIRICVTSSVLASAGAGTVNTTRVTESTATS